jgi:hypothetical protein
MEQLVEVERVFAELREARVIHEGVKLGNVPTVPGVFVALGPKARRKKNRDEG